MRLRKLSPLFVLCALVAAPSFAGIHYTATTNTQDATGKSNVMEVEGWVAADKAKIEFKESGGNPVAKNGAYLLTRDGGKTIYLVDPKEKTYAEWDLQAMMSMVGGIMNGMGPLLKMEFSNPKVEKLLEENGGTVAGLPTTHYRYRTTYNMKVKVLGMGQESAVENVQDVWATDRLQDIALGVWLRSDPPRTGNANFDKLIASEVDKAKGFPLKTVTVSTSTPKKGKPTVTRTTMEVTKLDTGATVADASFQIPAGYQETQILPAAAEGGEGQEDAPAGLGGLLRGRKKGSGDDGR